MGGNSETEGGDGALSLGEGGQVMICSCRSRRALSTSFYLEDIGRNANELRRIYCRGCLPVGTMFEYKTGKKLFKRGLPLPYTFSRIPFSFNTTCAQGCGRRVPALSSRRQQLANSND